MSPREPERLALSYGEALGLLLGRAAALAPAAHGDRAMIGLAGGPGVGKSTLGAALVAALNAVEPGGAALVPMDGFHMRHRKLEALGFDRDKGAPHTFEAEAFAGFLSSVKAATTAILGPGYSRRIEDVVDDAVAIPASARTIVVEGNYLLLPDAPWGQVRELLDLAVLLHVPRPIVRERLLKRHAEEGLFSEDHIREHVDRVDLSNYDLVSTSGSRADLIIELEAAR